MNVIAKSTHLKLNSRNISETIKNRNTQKNQIPSRTLGATPAVRLDPLNSPGTPLGLGGPRAPVSPFFPVSPEGLYGPLGPTGPCAARGPASPLYLRVPLGP